MRYLLLTAISVLIFLCYGHIKNRQDLQVVYSQTEKGNGGVVFSLSRTKEATTLRFSTTSKEVSIGFVHFTPEKKKVNVTVERENSTSSRPAERTLEYMAMLLPGAQSFP